MCDAGWKVSDIKKDRKYHYLFTNKRISMPQQTKEEAVTEENVSGWIPLVNDKAVDAEDIYVDNGGGGSNSLLISSVNVKIRIRLWIIP